MLPNLTQFCTEYVIVYVYGNLCKQTIYFYVWFNGNSNQSKVIADHRHSYK